MEQLRQALRSALLLAGTFALFAVGYAALTVTQEVQQTAATVRTLAADVTTTSTKARQKLDQLDPLLTNAAAAVEQHRLAAVELKLAVATLNDPRSGLRPTLQNVNAVLVQGGIAADQVAQASIEERANLKNVDAGMADFARAMTALEKLLADPAWHGTAVNVEAATKSGAGGIEQVRQAIYDMQHPPKKSRGQKIVDWLVRAVVGNAIQGAVRR